MGSGAASDATPASGVTGADATAAAAAAAAVEAAVEVAVEVAAEARGVRVRGSEEEITMTPKCGFRCTREGKGFGRLLCMVSDVWCDI